MTPQQLKALQLYIHASIQEALYTTIDPGSKELQKWTQIKHESLSVLNELTGEKK